MTELTEDKGFKILSTFMSIMASAAVILASTLYLLGEGSSFKEYQLEVFIWVALLFGVLSLILAIFRGYSGKPSILLIFGAILYFVIGTLDWYFPNGLTLTYYYTFHYSAEDLVIGRWFVVLAVANVMTFISQYLRKSKKYSLTPMMAIIILIIYAVAFFGALFYLGYPTLDIPGAPTVT